MESRSVERDSGATSNYDAILSLTLRFDYSAFGVADIFYDENSSN